MYLYGASGHARVIIEILELLKISVEGIFDDNEAISKLLDYPVMGGYNGNKNLAKNLIISVGNNKVRLELAQKHQSGFSAALVHPKATVSSRAQIGEGSVVIGNAIINTGSIIGKHAIINTSASVDHDCTIGDFTHISPNATLSGGVWVGDGTHIGSGAVVIPNIKIGKWTTIGAGAVIIRDVEDYAVVVGNPGRVIKTGGCQLSKTKS